MVRTSTSPKKLIEKTNVTVSAVSVVKTNGSTPAGQQGSNTGARIKKPELNTKRLSAIRLKDPYDRGATKKKRRGYIMQGTHRRQPPPLSAATESTEPPESRVTRLFSKVRVGKRLKEQHIESKAERSETMHGSLKGRGIAEGKKASMHGTWKHQGRHRRSHPRISHSAMILEGISALLHLCASTALGDRERCRLRPVEQRGLSEKVCASTKRVIGCSRNYVGNRAKLGFELDVWCPFSASSLSPSICYRKPWQKGWF